MSRNFTEEIKYQWNHGGTHIKLIGINLAVFLLIRILLSIGGLMGQEAEFNITYILNQIFVLHGDLSGLLTHPWGIVTSIFAHYDTMHLLFNMVFLFFSSQMFLQFFSSKRLLYVYVVGGIFGGLVQIIAHQVFPGLQNTSIYVVGASGSIMAIFLSLAFHRPNAKVHLFGVFPVRIIYLGLLFILQDFLGMGKNDGIAHFAHLGGALLGYLSVQKPNSPKNIINWIQITVENLFNKKATPRSSRSKMKVVKNKSYNTKSDEDYREFKKTEQEQVDAILMKIKKAGYDSLTKREKEILFEYSRNVK